MSRRPGYETTSYTGHGYESRRETMAPASTGRPRGAAGPDAQARAAWPGLISDGELQRLQMRMRLLELTAPR